MVRLTEQSTADDKVSVTLIWRMKNWALQYRVTITSSFKPRGEPFSLDGRHRRKLALQNAHCPALKTFDATLWYAISSEDLCSYFGPFREGSSTSEFDFLIYKWVLVPLHFKTCGISQERQYQSTHLFILWMMKDWGKFVRKMEQKECFVKWYYYRFHWYHYSNIFNTWKRISVQFSSSCGRPVLSILQLDAMFTKTVRSSALQEMQYRRMVANRVQEAGGSKGREKMLILRSYRYLELLGSIGAFAVYCSLKFWTICYLESELKLSFVDI